MKISCVIPVFNHLDVTRACLRSLEETVSGVEYEVILVNDASDDATTQGLRELQSDRVALVQNPRNCGYAYSNNQGAARATGEILFLLNNDLVFLPGWLEPMLNAFQKVKKLGLVGNVQLNAATGEIDHAGVLVSLRATLDHKRSPNGGQTGTPAYTRVHLITAACCAIRRDLFLRAGGFDEAFVNGGEDMDLCFRLSRLGYRIAVANQSVVKHHVSASRSGPNLNNERNSRLLQRKWGPQIARLAASRWPDAYLASCLEPSAWPTIDGRLLCAALSRFLSLKKGPAPHAINAALCELERKERHWKKLLDGWTDDMIRMEERNKHASPLKDSYEFEGLYFNSERAGVWIREKATIVLPRGSLVSSIGITGRVYPANPALPEERGKPGLAITANAGATRSYHPLDLGEFAVEFTDPPIRAEERASITITLLGAGKSNAFAYFGRILANVVFIPRSLRRRLSAYRTQRLNKRLAIHSIQVNGEDVFNFQKDPANPLNTEYALRHAHLGINVVGWFKAELGIGESARLAAKALKATDIPYSLVPLKVNCLASQGDRSLENELDDKNPHPVNVFHIDAPQSPDIDHHHGPRFRAGKYNIAYWAWELPDFPDRWIKHFRHFDEIWTPSNFVRDSIAMKSPVPVVTVPHCIDFPVPTKDYRSELGLPQDKFLFTFAYDLNSYQERKNPKAVIEAFRLAFSGSDRAADVGLVIKIHSTKNNEDHYRELQELLRDVPGFYLVDRTLSREATYGLMKACDCYVSLHRAEGFGLTVAESMFLEKPVITTNWSATTEFANASNACPVAFTLKRLERNFGPYEKGQVWADPDPEDAARHMQRMVADPEWAAQLGSRARQTIIDLYSPQRIADIYRRRLRAIALW